MNRLATYFLFFIMSFMLPVSFAAESDESGIGGTGISQPALEDGVFNRPEIPEFIDTPESPEISLPEINDAREDGLDTSIEPIETPADTSD